MSIFRNARFRNARTRFARFTAPRPPRHRILRLLLGVVGAGLLLALPLDSVSVGIAMLGAGMLWRLWKQRNQPLFVRGAAIDGDFRVVGKAHLPLAR